jgi:hypothetical protein
MEDWENHEYWQFPASPERGRNRTRRVMQQFQAADVD